MGDDQFGPYLLVALLGRGGMGEVWRAVDTRKDREVAVKRLGAWLGGDEDFARRFQREAAQAARLNAPNIVPIHDYGEIDGHLYIDMPLIDGVDLDTLLQRSGPFAVERAVAIVGQVGRALTAAHRAGLVHRDIKPSNILVTDNDGEEHVYLIDFGISRAVDGSKLSLTGAAIGTPAYMAPERFAGEGDHRGDIYALGCVLHEVLTGRQPHVATNPMVYMNLHMNATPSPPSALRPDLPRQLDQVVARALAKKPEERFGSAAEFVTAARAAVHAPPLPDRITPAPGPVRTEPAGPSPASPTALAPAPSTPVPPRAALPAATPPTPVPPTAVLPSAAPPAPSGPVPADPTVNWAPSAAPRAGSRWTRWRLVGAATLAVLLVATGVVVTSTLLNRRTELPTVASMPLTGSVELPADPGQIALSPDGTLAYVAHSSGGRVSIVDTTRPDAPPVVLVLTNAPTRGSFSDIAVSVDGASAYVTDMSAGSLSIVDTTRPTAQPVLRQVGAGPSGVARSEDGTRVFVANAQTNDVSVIRTYDPTADPTTVRADRPPNRLAVSRNGARLYLTNGAQGSVSVVDTTHPDATPAVIAVGGQPYDIAIAPDGQHAYVSDSANDVVMVLDTVDPTTPPVTIPVGDQPTDLAVSADGSRVYVLNYVGATMSVIDTGTAAVVAEAEVGGHPAGLALSPDGARAYVTSSDDHTLSVVATR